MVKQTLTSWGNVVHAEHEVLTPQWLDEVPKMVEAAKKPLLACGLRRSYGDSPLNPEGTLLDMTGLDRVIAFDTETGVLRAEAGASLLNLIPLLVKKGWFFATTPGTRFVTLGGAVAHDIHGKNHHSAGTFGAHVRAMGLVMSDGSALELLPEDKLFQATVGGMGLTGIITWVEVQLVKIPSVYVLVERVPFKNLAEFWELAETSTQEFCGTWLDAMSAEGRGIFERSDWMADRDYTFKEPMHLTFPFTPPITPLNRWSVWLHNRYHAWRGQNKPRVESFAKAFYPLDSKRYWNRLYGRMGFYQYQCVLPKSTMKEALPELLKLIAASGQASFLATLKTLKDKPSPGMMSFPMEGITLALDFPNRGETTMALFEKLDAVVREAGGRLYAAKDGASTAAMFRAGYPRLEEFRTHVDAGMGSQFWQRLGLVD